MNPKITESPNKKVFYIDISGIEKSKVNDFIKQTKAELQKLSRQAQIEEKE